VRRRPEGEPSDAAARDDAGDDERLREEAIRTLPDLQYRSLELGLARLFGGDHPLASSVGARSPARLCLPRLYVLRRLARSGFYVLDVDVGQLDQGRLDVFDHRLEAAAS